MDVEKLRVDLVRLRSGAGLQAPRLRERLGADLGQVCGVRPEDTDGQLRARVIATLTRAIARLTAQDALAVRMALNIDPDFQSRFLKERMAFLGHAISRDPRTAVRRVDDAFDLLSEELADESPTEDAAVTEPRSRFAPGGWYFDSLDSTLELDTGLLTLTERRRVTATVDGLDGITVGWSTERATEYEAAFGVELLDGGDLVPDPDRIEKGMWAGEVRLPRPLAAGQTHEFCTRVTQSGRMEPYYIVTPFRRTDLFRVRVIFRSEPRPVQAWRLDGEPARIAGDPFSGVMAEIGDDGELSATFEQLDIGLSYGIRWAALT